MPKLHGNKSSGVLVLRQKPIAYFLGFWATKRGILDLKFCRELGYHPSELSVKLQLCWTRVDPI